MINQFKPITFTILRNYPFGAHTGWVPPEPEPASPGTDRPKNGSPVPPNLIADRLPATVRARLEEGGAPKRRYRPFPLLGDDHPDLLAAAAAIDWAVWRQRFAATPESVTLYQANSRGTRMLAGKVKAGLVKLGLTTKPDPRFRTERLNIECYGSLHATADGTLVESAGYDSWQPQCWPEDCVTTHGGPVTWSARGLHIALPVGLDFATMEKRVQETFAPAALYDFVDTDHGREHLSYGDATPRQAQRYTAYVVNGEYDLRRALEIYLFPKGSEQRVVRLVEGIIAKFLMTTPPR